MSSRLSDIWRIPVYLPYLQPSLTDETIAAAEAFIGQKLPAAYLALLRQQNGGFIRYTLPESGHSLIYGIGPHFPSLTGFDWEDAREYVSFELDGLVPFDGDGHWHLCLDYRGGRTEPAVTLVDLECDHETPIAHSFEEYLGLLQFDEGEGDFLVLPEVLDLDGMLDELAARLGVEFYEPDVFQDGYPVYRARDLTAKTPEWIWMSPNKVPRGFVRENDKRYDELKNRLPGEALRYPEIPSASYLMSATEGLRERLLQACSDLSIEFRPLAEYLAAAQQ